MADKRSGKPFIVAALLALGGLGLGLHFLQSFLGGGEIEDVARHLPSNTKAFVAGKGSANLALEFDQFEVILESIGPLLREGLERETSLDLGNLGFDPLSLVGWHSTGIDFGKPCALSSTAGTVANPESITLLVPIRDETVFGPILLGVLEIMDVERKEVEIAGREVTVMGDQVALTMEGDYLLLVAVSAPGDNPESAMKAHFEALEEGSLMDREEFTELSLALGTEWHFMTYGSGSVFADFHDALGMEEISQWMLPVEQALPRSFASTLHLNDQRARLRYAFLTNTDYSPYLGSAEDDFATSVSGDPLAAARISFNAGQIWESLMAEPEVRGTVAFALAAIELGSSTKIETDLVRNINGNLSVVLLQAPSNPSVPFDLLIYAGLKDPQIAGKAVSHLCTMGSLFGLSTSPEGSEEAPWCSAESGGFGLVRNHLVFASSTSLAGELRNSAGEGFVKSLPPSAQKELLSGSPLYAYLDLAGWYEILGEADLPQDLVAFRDDIGLDTLPEDLPLPVDGLSIHADVSDMAILVDASIHAAEGGFQAQLLSASNNFFETWREGLNTQQLGELENSVEGLRMSEMGFNAAFGELLACGSQESAERRALANQPLSPEEQSCWMDLGFLAPQSGQYGFWVEVSGEDFTAHGIVDADGDGEPAHYEATRNQAAYRVSPADVH